MMVRVAKKRLIVLSMTTLLGLYLLTTPIILNLQFGYHQWSDPGSVPLSHHHFFGTRTPRKLFSGNMSDHKFMRRPEAVFSIHRHGIRNIVDNFHLFDFINGVVEKLRNCVLKSEVDDMDWILNFTFKTPPNGDLRKEGYYEILDQGNEFRKAFPELLKDPGRVQMSTCPHNRCIASGLSFLYGVFGNTYRVPNADAILDLEDVNLFNGNVTKICGSLGAIEPMCSVYRPLHSPLPDASNLKMFNFSRKRLLEFYLHCEGCGVIWNYANKRRHDVPDRFAKHPKIVNLLRRVGGRTGLPLVYEDLIALHILCSLELTLPHIAPGSQFCTLFRSDELDDMGFFVDLLVHKSKSTPARVKSGCIIIQEALRTLKQKEVSFYFTHFQTMLPFAENMGVIARPLTAWKDIRQVDDYFGDMFGYGSSFTMVALQDDCNTCGGTVVQTFLNERVIEIPGCGSPCTLQKLEQMFPDSQCSYRE